jgi:hypothetical protein
MKKVGKRSKHLKSGDKTFSAPTTLDISEISDEQGEIAAVFAHLCLGVNPSIDPSAAFDMLLVALPQGLTCEEATKLGQKIALTHGHPSEETH